MIIDIHTHTYPDEIATYAMEKLAHQTNIHPYTDGTFSGLLKSQEKSGVDLSIILPVVTRARQTEKINNVAAKINSTTSQTHIMSFAGIHPDNDDYKQLIRGIADNGFIGIKLHPMFQQVPLDDIRYIRLIDEAMDKGLKVLIHAGADINFVDCDYAIPERTRKMLSALPATNGIILAHMGGILFWDKVIDLLGGYEIYLDTSSTICDFLSYEGKKIIGQFRNPLNHSIFNDIVHAFGADHILFGSDSPWQDQQDAINDIKSTGLDEKTIQMILGENTAKLLNINITPTIA